MLRHALNDANKPVNGSSVLLLGVMYKANISDERETPARPLAGRLLKMGASMSFYDSYVECFEVDGVAIPQAPELEGAPAAANLVFLIQPHDEIIAAAPFSKAALLLDPRGVVEGPSIERLRSPVTTDHHLSPETSSLDGPARIRLRPTAPPMASRALAGRRPCRSPVSAVAHP
jgi:UDP-N-acetyl-D-mannosaminuronate dehydrogenase